MQRQKVTIELEARVVQPKDSRAGRQTNGQTQIDSRNRPSVCSRSAIQCIANATIVIFVQMNTWMCATLVYQWPRAVPH